MAFNKGDKVAQVLPAPIVGTIESFNFDEGTRQIKNLVTWTDAEGNTHSRYFTDEELTSQA